MAEKIRHIRLDELIEVNRPPIKIMDSSHYSVDRHDHDFYELVYVREGFCLHEIREKITLLMEGDLFIVNPGVAHRYIGRRMMRNYNCLFNAQALEYHQDALTSLSGLERLFARESGDCVPHLHLSLNERKKCLRQIADMYEEYTDMQPGWAVRLISMLQCLLVDYSRYYSAHMSAGNGGVTWSGYVSQALIYIDAHYSDPTLSVRKIAQEAGISADYLSRQFKRSLGIAAQEYLKRYRFARAMELLQQGLPISKVALQVGFASLSNFSREFKKELGITPSQYRFQNEP